MLELHELYDRYASVTNMATMHAIPGVGFILRSFGNWERYVTFGPIQPAVALQLPVIDFGEPCIYILSNEQKPP